MTELSGRGIRCVDEAPDGSLWFGGIGGLMRYDGMQVEWMPFDEKLKSAIGFNLSRDLWCYSFLCMPDGSLLAVIESSLMHWKDGEWSILRKGLGSADYETRLVRADDGIIWLLRTNALRRFSSDLSQEEVVLKTSKNKRLGSFCLDAEGDAWVVVNRPSGMVELVHIPPNISMQR